MNKYGIIELFRLEKAFKIIKSMSENQIRDLLIHWGAGKRDNCLTENTSENSNYLMLFTFGTLRLYVNFAVGLKKLNIKPIKTQ